MSFIKLKYLLLSVFLITRSHLLQAENLNDINLGAMLHLTGNFSMEGKAFLEGIKVAVDEINMNGGIKDRKLNLILEDTAYDQKNSVLAANKFINGNKKVSGIIVSTLHEIKATSKLFEKANIPSIVLWDSTPEIENMGNTVFAIGPWAPDTGEKSSRFAFNTLKKKTAAIICNQHDWGLSVTNYFKSDFEKRGGKIVTEEILNPDTNDFKSILIKLKSKNPEVIYAPLTFGMINFAKQLKQFNITAPVIMSDNITDVILSNSNKALEGFYHSSVADPNNKETEDFKLKYFQKFNTYPKMVLFNTWGYDSVKIFENAIINSQSENIDLTQSMYKINKHKGASGEISFNRNGSSPMFISMFQVKDNKLEVVEGADVP